MADDEKKASLPPAIQRLAESIDKAGLKIKFGLEQQGHIPTIERMLDATGSNEYTWKKIGEEINWCPNTAAYYYIKYLREHAKINSPSNLISE